MKILRSLFALAALCVLTHVALADDFKMIVVDPSPININLITSDSFTFNFSPCAAGLLPGAYVGCFIGVNETGKPLTSLQLEVPFIPGQTAGCPLLGGRLDVFSNVTCGLNPDGMSYYLDFSGGSIPSTDGDLDFDDLHSVFLIAEAGVPASSFPEVAASFNTPEPASFWLLLSGTLLGAGLIAERRRVAAQLAS